MTRNHSKRMNMRLHRRNEKETNAFQSRKLAADSNICSKSNEYPLWCMISSLIAES